MIIILFICFCLFFIFIFIILFCLFELKYDAIFREKMIENRVPTLVARGPMTQRRGSIRIG